MEESAKKLQSTLIEQQEFEKTLLTKVKNREQELSAEKQGVDLLKERAISD